MKLFIILNFILFFICAMKFIYYLINCGIFNEYDVFHGIFRNQIYVPKII